MRRPLVLAASLLVAGFLLAQTTAVEITAEPDHHLALENAYVRAFKAEVPPHGATLLHRHRHDYIFVSLGPSQISNEVEGKTPVTLQMQDGETRFAVGNFAHIARNLSDKPFRVIAVELMQDEQAHTSPPLPWDEERGLHVLDRGTLDIMFVKDGVRVSETELQPGGVIPQHHHAGPHLVVALTDFELRSDVPGKASNNIAMKAGDIKWVDGGVTHAVTNIGKQEAKFVAMEFH